MKRHEKIQKMSIEEMAKYFDGCDCSFCIMEGFNICNGDCVEGRKQWLESEDDDEEKV